MSSENTRPAAPSRRTGRTIGGLLLLLLAGGLLYGGISAITDPSSATSNAANTGRSIDSEAEAKLGGLLFCTFAVSSFCFGISLLRTKPAKDRRPHA